MKESENTERKKLLLAKIAQFRLFDDDFMSKVFEDDIEATEFLLKILLEAMILKLLNLKARCLSKTFLVVPYDLI